ncbi:MAG: Type 1 glutamine amidotransferase-like domain-containing protein [bacterium]|nr:Type 1 glutamine amidotransferase-like domain-containing protein [bacterium]
MKEVLFIAGGGNEIDSKKLDDLFVSTIKNREGRGIVYIPIAMEPHRFPQCLEWFTSVFKDRVQIEMWTELKDKTKDDISKLGGIYIGGGDTVRLLQALQESGFDDVLTTYIKNGGIVYGGSAGAIILGQDIRTAPETEKYHLDNYAGLNVLGEYSVTCHFKQEETSHYQDISKRIASPIIALSEQSGVRISGANLEIVGNNSVFIISPTSVKIISPNQNIKIK